METFTVITDAPRETAATIDGDAIRLPADTAEAATGWSLKPEGLCQGDICVPVHDRATIESDTGIDLVALADAVHQPLAIDRTAGVAALGHVPGGLSQTLDDDRAPDWTLPDLDGNLVSLADFKGRKKLLLTWASW
jgi:hypothetical protein